MKQHACERVSRWVLNAAAALAGLIAVVAIGALLAGVRPVIFISGSMGPDIETGALALIRQVPADNVAIGDVVSVVGDDGVRITHRVVSVDRQPARVLIGMQGDANKVPDANQYDITQGTGRLIWHANGLGRVIAGVKAWPVIGCAIALVVIAFWPGRQGQRRAKDLTVAVPPHFDQLIQPKHM